MRKSRPALIPNRIFLAHRDRHCLPSIAAHNQAQFSHRLPAPGMMRINVPASGALDDVTRRPGAWGCATHGRCALPPGDGFPGIDPHIVVMACRGASAAPSMGWSMP
jgi:hypothetical protein